MWQSMLSVEQGPVHRELCSLASHQEPIWLSLTAWLTEMNESCFCLAPRNMCTGRCAQGAVMNIDIDIHIFIYIYGHRCTHGCVYRYRCRYRCSLQEKPAYKIELIGNYSFPWHPRASGGIVTSKSKISGITIILKLRSLSRDSSRSGKIGRKNHVITRTPSPRSQKSQSSSSWSSRWCKRS